MSKHYKHTAAHSLCTSLHSLPLLLSTAKSRKTLGQHINTVLMAQKQTKRLWFKIFQTSIFYSSVWIENLWKISNPTEDNIFLSLSEGTRSHKEVENCHLHHMHEQKQLLLCLNRAAYKHFTLQQALYGGIQELQQFKVTMTFHCNLPGICSLICWIALHWNIYYTSSISVKLKACPLTMNVYFPQIQYGFYLPRVWTQFCSSVLMPVLSPVISTRVGRGRGCLFLNTARITCHTSQTLDDKKKGFLKGVLLQYVWVSSHVCIVGKNIFCTGVYLWTATSLPALQHQFIAEFIEENNKDSTSNPCQAPIKTFKTIITWCQLCQHFLYEHALRTQAGLAQTANTLLAFIH